MAIKRFAKREPPAQDEGQNSVSTLPTLDAEWSKLGVTHGYDPLDLDASRLMVFGPVKEGKTYFTMSWPDNLQLDFEDASRTVVGARSHRVYVPSVEVLDKLVTKLEADALRGKRQFKRVTFDTIDRLQDLYYDAFKGIYGKDLEDYRGGKGGWKTLNVDIAGYWRRLYKAGYAWTAVCHQRYVTVPGKDGKEVSATKLGPTPGIIASLQQDADYLCSVGMETTWSEEPDPKNPRITRRVPAKRVLLATIEGDGRGLNAELGTRVPLSPFIEIPIVNGYDAMKEDWDVHVEQERERDRVIREG